MTARSNRNVVTGAGRDEDGDGSVRGPEKATNAMVPLPLPLVLVLILHSLLLLYVMFTPYSPSTAPTPPQVSGTNGMIGKSLE